MIAFDREIGEVYCDAGGAEVGHPSGGLGRVVHLLAGPEAAVYRRIPAKLRFVSDSLFGQEGCEEILLGQGARWAQSDAPDGEAGLAPGREELLFLQYNYARYRLAQARAGSDDALVQAREMVVWQERAGAARTKIAQANLALVVSMAARSRYSHVDFSDLVAEGNLALLRSIDSFDVSRGFRFSTYAFQSVGKSFHRLAATARRALRIGMVGLGAVRELAEPSGQGSSRQRQEAIDSVREALESERSGLTSVERTVVMERFGLGGEGLRRSLCDVGTMMGLSHSRVRRLQKVALDKMRLVLTDGSSRPGRGR